MPDANVIALIERAKKERQERDSTAWAACVHITDGQPEHAAQMAQKAMEYHEQWQDTLRSIGLSVYLTGVSDA